MKIRTIYLLLVFYLLSSGCEKIDLGKPFDSKIGNTYYINPDLTFSIDSINDSRCPENLMCFWAGDVNLYLNINYSNTHIDTTMYLRNTTRNPIKIGDYSFKVLEVNPISGGTTTSKDVTIKMIITKY
jgi:hypothetical protein